MYTSNKKFILKYFRCRDGKRTETRIGMEGICITHSCIPLHVHCVHATHNGSQWWNAGMGNTDTLHPNSCFCSFSIPTFRIKFLLLVCLVFMRMRTKPHPHRRKRRALKCSLCLLWSVPFLPSPEVLNSC